MNRILKGIIGLSFMVVCTVASQDIELFSSPNPNGKITPATIQAAFEKAGFTVSANRNMNGPFKKQFKASGFDVYNLFTFYKKETVLALVKKYPNVGLFAPMSMSIYTKKGEKKISVAGLSAETMARIMKIPSSDTTLKKLKNEIKKVLKTAMPRGTFETLPYQSKPSKGNLVTHFTMNIDPKDWEDELEEFKMGLEGELAPNGFVIAGFNNLGDNFDDVNYNGYDFYEVYSICKLPVIYTIAKTHPEAGAFAPCSLYLEKKKGNNKMEVAFPSVYNWMSTMSIEDSKDIKILKGAQAGMEKILKGLME
ncbi:MAG: DUF302 domain-containing protein [Sulfurovum sp.]|nr:DUF302 domain-containing protein [Sulfurovum sp.]MCB4758365.1 DUF302 domain-containing protein [Sulfurovum sp.]MCB4761255.1 DUF302 domain-containing protein [Sulfurovum sp.]MCB4763351.1 DUF302 domain-containing protein [Sulfurovum sp.]MCB4764484.1 DUF302 domain-containing protein [Sulfurovum sp.]